MNGVAGCLQMNALRPTRGQQHPSVKSRLCDTVLTQSLSFFPEVKTKKNVNCRVSFLKMFAITTVHAMSNFHSLLHKKP